MSDALFPPRPTWIEISRGALTNNVRQLRRAVGPNCLLTAVIKANGYGHGAALIAPTLLAAGADWLAVATLSEALELRAARIDAPILILGYTPGYQARDVVAQDLTATIFDLETACAFAEAAAQLNKRARVHLKVNTGMNRLGISPDDAPDLLTQLGALPALEVEGIFTHFATSDDDLDFARTQFERFRRLLARLEQSGMRPPIAHAANSAAALNLPETHLQMVRCGIALYGLHPDMETSRLPQGFLPALRWKAHIAQVTRLQPGHAVSYGREFVADRPMTVAVIPVGYADGFPRRPNHWGSVLVHGQPAPILGRVCMDQTIVDVTAIQSADAPVRQGDEAILIGQQGDACLTAEEVGRRLGTINYDVVSRILARVPRLLVDE